MATNAAPSNDLEALVGASTLAFVGVEFDDRTGTVDRNAFQRWAAAVPDRNPLYFDPDVARAHGHRDVVMPPLFVQYVPVGVVHLDQLNPDGTPTTTGIGALPLPDGSRVMAAGLTLLVDDAVYPGERIRGVSTLLSVEPRHGRSGAFALVRIGTRFTRADTVVTTIDASFVVRP